MNLIERGNDLFWERGPIRYLASCLCGGDHLEDEIEMWVEEAVDCGAAGPTGPSESLWHGVGGLPKRVLLSFWRQRR